MASFFSKVLSFFRAEEKSAPPPPSVAAPSPYDAAPPAPPREVAPVPTTRRVGGLPPPEPEPILNDPRGGRKPGIFTKMLGQKAPQNAWQDPLWIPASQDLQQLAKQEETRKKVLVIDSDAVAVADCKAMLENEGFVVETAFDGEEGVQKIFESNPDAVIMRLVLPKVNGVELVRRLRTLEPYKRLPVIALAEHGANMGEAEALAAGATRVFDRGLATEEDLFLALRTALRKRVFTPKKSLFQSGQTGPIKLGTSIVSMPEDFGRPISAPQVAPAPPMTPVVAAPSISAPPAAPATNRIVMPPAQPFAPSGPLLPATAPAGSIPQFTPPPTATPAPAPAPVGGLPLPQPITTPGIIPPTGPVPLAGLAGSKRILLIEDEEMVATIYRARLTRAGYVVELALDGETGLQRLRESPPDAVLLDAHLPRMDGLQVLQMIRSEPQLGHLPVILCTAAMNQRMQEEAMLAGAVRVLDKTAITPLQVVEAVQSLFNEQTTAKTPVPMDATASTIRKITTRIPTPPPPGNDLPDFLPPDDAAFEAEIKEAFLQEAPMSVATIGADAKALMKTAAGAPERDMYITALFKNTHKLAGTAGLAGFSQVSRLSSAIEALLLKIQEKPERLNASCMRTLVQAVDYIGLLFSRASALRDFAKQEALALVVDDEMIGRRYVAHSLTKAEIAYQSAANAVEALKLLQEHRFDIIFLDVEMPGMNGFDLCKHLRTLPNYDKTPVIFVTSLNSFDALAKSRISGGTDFLAKPFSYAELSVKALTQLARRQMELLPEADQQKVAAAAAALSAQAAA